MNKQQEFRKQTEEAKLEAFSLMCRKVAELEKENAELKRELEEADNATDCFNKQEEIIAKAKELLNEFMRISKASDEDFEHDYSELIGDTEQFLKDSEEK